MKSMKRKAGVLVVMAGALVLYTMGLSGAAEKKCESKKVDIKDLPELVMLALEKAYPQAKVKEIEKADQDGKVCYELEVKTKDKSQKDILISASGTILEIKEELAIKSLPEAVQKAVASAYPQGKIKEAEKTTKDTSVEYQVDIKNDKEKLELVFEPNGTILSIKKDTGDKGEGEK